MRVDVTHHAASAPTRARSWMGVNAIHRAARDPRAGSTAYDARKPVIDGLEYHEGLNAVCIRGGVAGNVLPDECVVEVNYRFAPDRSEAEAEAFVREFFDGYDVTVTDSAPGALPGPRPCRPPRRSSRRSAATVNPKFGWTDVARFTAPRRPGGQLRPRRPDARPQAGGARAGRAHRALRAAAAGLARRRPR